MAKFNYKKSGRIHLCPVIILSFISLLQVTLSVAQYYYDYAYIPYVFKQDYYYYRRAHPLTIVNYPQILPLYSPAFPFSSESESEEATPKPGIHGTNQNQTGIHGTNQNQTGIHGSNQNQTGIHGTNQNQTGIHGSNQNQSGEQGSNHKPRPKPQIEGRASTVMQYNIFDRECKAYYFGRNADANRPTTPKPKLNAKGFLTDCWIDIATSIGFESKIWKVDAPIKIIIHGFTPKTWDDGDDIIENQGLFRMGEEFSNDTNVIVVDWTVYSGTPYYPSAAANTVQAGIDVANFLATMQQRNNWGKRFWSNMHFIGFSLGAHVSGIAGQVLLDDFDVRAGRITGLDPAGPNFDGSGGSWPDNLFYSLNRDDAGFVDIVHCNMGTPLSWLSATLIGKYGTWLERGDVDFYPNGGERQYPFCSEWDDLQGCSHNTCIRYYTKSIRQKDYLACRCDSWGIYLMGLCRCKKNTASGTLMGERLHKRIRGRYYLSITS